MKLLSGLLCAVLPLISPGTSAYAAGKGIIASQRQFKAGPIVGLRAIATSLGALKTGFAPLSSLGNGSLKIPAPAPNMPAQFPASLSDNGTRNAAGAQPSFAPVPLSAPRSEASIPVLDANAAALVSPVREDSVSQIIPGSVESGRFQASVSRINGKLKSTLAALMPRGLSKQDVEAPERPVSGTISLAPIQGSAPSASSRIQPDREPNPPQKPETVQQKMSIRSFLGEMGATLSYVVGSIKKVPTHNPQKPYAWKYTPPHSLVFATGILGALFSFNVSDILEIVILPLLVPKAALPAVIMGIPFSWALLGGGVLLIVFGFLFQRLSRPAGAGIRDATPAGSLFKRLAQRLGFDFAKEPEKAFSVFAVVTFLQSVAEKVYSMMQKSMMQALNLGSTGVGTLRNYMWYATVFNRPIVGAFADKLDIKKGFVLFSALSAVIFAGIPALLIMGKLSMISLAVLSFLSYLSSQIAGSITQNRLQNEIAGDQEKARSSGNVLTSMWRNYGTYIGLALGAIMMGTPAAAAAGSVTTLFAGILFLYVGIKLLAAVVFYFGIHIPGKNPGAAQAETPVPAAQPKAGLSPASETTAPARKNIQEHIGRALSFVGFAGAMGGAFLVTGMGFNVFALFLGLSLAWGVGPHLGAKTAKKLLKNGILGSSEKKILSTVRILSMAPLLLTSLLAGSHLPLWVAGIAIASALVGIYTVRECVCAILANTLIQDNAVVPQKEQGKAAAAVITMTYMGTIISNKILKWLLPKDLTIQLFWDSPYAIMAIVIGAVALAVYTAFIYPKLSHLHEWMEKVKAR